MRIIVLIFAAFLAGCGSTTITRDSSTVTTVRDTVLWVVPSEIKDTVFLNGENIGATLRGRDTVVKVQYFPKERKVFVTAKPDTVFVTYKDTTSVTQTNVTIKEKSFWENVTGWIGSQFLYLFGAIAIAVIIIMVVRKK